MKILHIDRTRDRAGEGRKRRNLKKFIHFFAFVFPRKEKLCKWFSYIINITASNSAWGLEITFQIFHWICRWVDPKNLCADSQGGERAAGAVGAAGVEDKSQDTTLLGILGGKRDRSSDLKSKAKSSSSASRALA